MLVVLVAILSVCTLFLIKLYLKPDLGDNLIGALLLLPAALTWAAQSNVAELAGFGFSAKFEKVARTSTAVAANTIPDQVLQLFDDVNKQDLEKIAFWEQCSPVVILRPEQGNSSVARLNEYVAATSIAISFLQTCDDFVGAIVVDSNNRYIGSFGRRFFAQAAWFSQAGKNAESRVKHGSDVRSMTVYGAAIAHPVQRLSSGEGFSATILSSATVRDALKQFQDNPKASFLTVTDSSNVVKGVIERADLAEGIILKLLESDG